MLDELIEMLAHPEQYECVCYDGELYVRRCLVAVEAPPVRVREPEPARWFHRELRDRTGHDP